MSRNRLLALVAALVVASTALRAVVAASGYFYWDDLLLHSRAASHPLPDADLLFADHDGHLMPGGMALVWIAAHAAPLQWWMPVTQIALLQLVASGALARLLWVLSQGSPQLLGPLLLALLSPLALPSATWWSAALLALPMWAALAWASAEAVRWRRGGGRRHLVLGTLAVAVGLVFTEKALLVPVVSWMLAAGDALVRGDGVGRRHLVRRLLPLVGCQALVVAVWAAVYTRSVGDPSVRTPEGPRGVGTLELADHVYRLAVAPTLAGGPWHWERWHPGPPFAAPPVLAVILGAVLIVAVLAWSVAARRGAAVIWAVAWLYPTASVVAVAWARRGPGTAAEIVHTLRYHGDTVVVLAAAGALVLASPVRAGRPRENPQTAARPVLVVSLLLVCASSLVSTYTFRSSWADQPSRRYLEPLLASLRERTEPMLDQRVPPEVLLPVTHPDDRLSRVLTGVDGLPPFTSWTGDPVLVDRDGRLVPAEVNGIRTLDPGTEPGCGHRIAAAGGGGAPAPPAGGRIPLDGPLLDREWTVRLNYFAGADGHAGVALDDGPRVEVPLRAGLHSVVVRLEGHGSGVRLTPSTETGAFCVGSGPVGVLVPR